MKQETLRLTSHPVLEVLATSRSPITINVDGQPLEVIEGDNLAAALWANRIFTLRHDKNTDTPRGVYCGIGHCYECRVTIDGIEGIRACLIPVREGMRIRLGDRFNGSPGDSNDR